MKLSKRDRRIITRCVNEGHAIIDGRVHSPVTSPKDIEIYEELYSLFLRISARLEGKHGKRRHDRGV